MNHRLFAIEDAPARFEPVLSDALLTPDGRRWMFADGTTVPVVAGGAVSTVEHPLGPPAISGTQITLDTMLRQPTRVTRMIMDLTLQRFIADRIFASAGGVTGGAVVYDQAVANELYLDRDVEQVAPGNEFPLVTSARQAPKIAPVEKWGGKFFVTDEARDRNDVALFTNRVRQLSNTIVRKINTRAIEVLEAAITALGGAGTFVGNDWSAAIPNGNSPSLPADTPGADLATAQELADVEELGVQFDTIIVNPVQMLEFNLFYGAGNARQVLADLGFDEMYASNRVAAGTAYVVASRQVGEMRVEQPLGTETSREGAPQLRQRTWVQSSVRPVMYVTNPYAVKKITGL